MALFATETDRSGVVNFMKVVDAMGFKWYPQWKPSLPGLASTRKSVRRCKERLNRWI